MRAKDIRMGGWGVRGGLHGYEVAAGMVGFGMMLGLVDGLSDLPSPWSLGVAAIIIGVIVVGIPKIPRK